MKFYTLALLLITPLLIILVRPGSSQEDRSAVLLNPDPAPTTASTPTLTPTVAPTVAATPTALSTASAPLSRVEPPQPLPTAAPASSAASQEPSSTQDILSRAALAQLVCAAFPSDIRMCTHVVWAESIGDWNPNWIAHVYGGVFSPTGDCGLGQINWSSHAQRFAAHGWSVSDCFNPQRNVVIMQEVYASQGPCAWMSYGC